MLDVYIYERNHGYASGITISLSVGGDDDLDKKLKHEFVACFDRTTRKVGLNNVEYIYLYEAKAALLAICKHRGLDNPLMDIWGVVNDRNSMDAITIDYLL